jgi:hypothetical protein
MTISRRALLTNAAPAVGALALAGCSNVLGTGIGINTTAGGGVTVTLPTNVNTFIQTIVQKAAQYAPTIESIAQEAASLFGPAYLGIVTIGSAAINTLITSLENLTAAPATAPATATTSAVVTGRRMGATLTAKKIGMTAQGVVVYGVR